MDGRDETIPCLLDLPDEIIFDIMSRVGVEDLLVCQTVSKRLLALTKEPQIINLQIERSKSHPHRIFFYNHGDSSLCTWNYLTGESRCKQIPNRFLEGDMRVNGSCNGLLCVSQLKGKRSTFIYNPMTKDSLKLPDYIFRKVKRFPGHGLAFGFDPVNKKYKVVRHMNWYMKEIITVGENSWRLLKFPHKLKICPGTERTVFVRGAFHWLLDSLNQVLVLDIATEEFRTISFIASPEMPPRFKLIGVGESLAFVEAGSHISYSFWIWRIIDIANGACRLQKSAFNMQSHPVRELYRYLGSLSENYFLFCRVQNRWLVLLDSKRERCSFSNAVMFSWEWLKASLFHPSLINPSAI